MKFDGNDQSKKIHVSTEAGSITAMVSVEYIKNDYICSGLSSMELSEKYGIPVKSIDNIIKENKLDELRAAYIKHGLAQLQNIQLSQAEKLMTLDNQFKKMRIIQIEKILEDHMAYYAKFGHFYKVHPVTLEILKDTNGIPMQIKIPNVSHEIAQLKESLSLSEGLKNMLSRIDDLINTPKDAKIIDPDVIDASNFDGLFQKKSSEDE